jgi:hypothetical protein
MENPGIWWGALGLILPILLHFWHHKKGKPIDWAATRFLKEIAVKRSRGFRLEDLPLLILRCAVLLSLLLFLSKPWIGWMKTEVVHWVEPAVKEQFKFEIEQAKQKGEKVLWFDGSEEKEPLVYDLQMGLNTWKGKAKHHIYLDANSDYSAFDQVFVPGEFELHISPSAARDTVEAPKNMVALVTYGHKEVIAALNSIREVLAVNVEIDTAEIEGKKYDIRFGAHAKESAELQICPRPEDKRQEVVKGNIIYLDQPWNQSDLVFDGRLPEWIWAKFQGPPREEISENQLKSKFQSRTTGVTPYEPGFFILFLVLLGWERWWSIRKNA